MTTSHKITAAALVFCALLMLCFGYGWFKEHDAAILVAAQQQANKEAAAVIANAEVANQKQLSATLASFTALKQQNQTPAQIVVTLPKVMPTLPAPIAEVTAAQAEAAHAAPSAPGAAPLQAGDLVIPKQDAKAFFDAQVDCKANESKVLSCGQTVTNMVAIDDVKDKQIAQLQTALKGGTKWQRTKTYFKVGGIGALVGAGVVAYLDHR